MSVRIHPKHARAFDLQALQHGLHGFDFIFLAQRLLLRQYQTTVHYHGTHQMQCV